MIAVRHKQVSRRLHYPIHLSIDGGSTSLCGWDLDPEEGGLRPQEEADCKRCLRIAEYTQDPDIVLPAEENERPILYVSSVHPRISAVRHYVLPDIDVDLGLFTLERLQSVCGLAYLKSVRLTRASDKERATCMHCLAHPRTPPAYRSEEVRHHMNKNRGGPRLPKGPTDKTIREH